MIRTPLVRRRLTRLGLLVGAIIGIVLVSAAAASAHVSVNPDTAVRGSSTELTFRVPNEEASAHTDKVTIQIPTTHPIAQVLVKPLPGWAITTRTTKLSKPLVTDDGKFTSVVSEITWSGGRIDPGQYQDFPISVDPLPDVATPLVFKALQTYSDGTVVRWIDLQQPGQGEPEHPAPVLHVTSSSSAEAPSSASGTASTGAGSRWAGVLAIVDLVLVLVSLGLLAGLLVRARRS